MKRNRILFIVAALIISTMLVAAPLPAMAESPTGSIVFFPVALGNGATYDCTGGPPFIHDPASPDQNCPLQQVGAPQGLVCDIPTNLTFVHDSYQYVADARLCQ